MNHVTVLLGAQSNAGFFLPGQYCPDETRFLIYPENEPEVQRYLHLLEFLGIPSQGAHLEFPIYKNDRKALQLVPGVTDLRPGEYVCIHPGASVPARRWSPERFAAVADKLAEQGLQVVLTGSAEEAGLTQAVSREMRAHSLNLAGCTQLGALAALIKDARLVVCNDTGVSHLADALRVPSVVVFMAADPQRWAPLDRQLHRVVQHLVECSPCQHSVCPIDHRCAMQITPEMVLKQARELLPLRKEQIYAA